MNIRKILKCFIGQGKVLMPHFAYVVKKAIKETSSPFSLDPKTNYNRHVPESARNLMSDNWSRTGNSLYNAMIKVRDSFEEEKQKTGDN